MTQPPTLYPRNTNSFRKFPVLKPESDDGKKTLRDMFWWREQDKGMIITPNLKRLTVDCSRNSTSENL